MKLHVVSFQVPYPANYGGVIDVWNKLKWLKRLGHEVTLHTYRYGDACEQGILNDVCAHVHYYERRTGLRRMLGTEPYIALSRSSEELVRDLLQDDYPILFEGLHTCHCIRDPRLKGRIKWVRMHNIEHEYYGLLARQQRWTWRSVYYRLEAWKLKRFERVLLEADAILAISEADRRELQERYPTKDVRWLPCFASEECCEAEGGTEPYVLYQGNLGVEENMRVADYIQRHLAAELPDMRFVLAGRNPRVKARRDNVEVVANPTEEEMDELLAKARVNLMLTFQPTGVKLKLMTALLRSRGHVVANEEMLHGHDMGRFCRVARDMDDMPRLVTLLMHEGPSAQEVAERQTKIKRENDKKKEKAGISRLSLFE